MNNLFNQAKKNVSNGTRVTIKLIVIFFLILILLIPQNMILDLIRERSNRQYDVEHSVANQVGGPIIFTGPVLAIPYTHNEEIIIKDENSKNKVSVETSTEYAYFTAKELLIESKTDVENKKKSIYKIPFIRSENTLSGNFTEPDFSNWDFIAPEHIKWDEAIIIAGIEDPNGLSDNPTIQWGNETLAFQPGSLGSSIFSNAIYAKLPKDWNDNRDFSISVQLRGTSSIDFASTANSNTMNMTSNWPHPNFESLQNSRYDMSGPAIDDYSNSSCENRGSSLPVSYEIYTEGTGFTSEWVESQFSIQQRPQWLSIEQAPNLCSRLMGVEFVNMSDNYSKTKRSIKYMALIIALVFTAFFIIELLRANRIHPFQYTLVGIAIAVFYLLLLAFSEYFGFNWAYLIASTATIALIGFYSVSIFKNKQLAAGVSTMLAVLFAFIFVILNATEYSLIIGSIGLFIILATVMYATRNITWYSKAES